jgi:hypothetical protein
MPGALHNPDTQVVFDVALDALTKAEAQNSFQTGQLSKDLIEAVRKLRTQAPEDCDALVAEILVKARDLTSRIGDIPISVSIQT